MSLFVFNNQQKLIKSIPNRDLISVVQDQAINVSDTLFVEMPADIWSNLKEPASYLAVQDPYERFSYHMYKVSKHTTKADTTDIEAIQIGYDELKAYGYIKDRRFNNRPVLEAATAIVDGTDWQLGYVDTDLPNVNTNFYYISRLEALSKLIEATGAEVRFRVEISGNKIIAKRLDLYKQPGTFKGKRFAYGSNLLEIIKEEDTSELYTALVGRGKGEETDEGGFGRRITFVDIAWSKASGKPVDKPLGQEFIELPEMTAYYGYPDGEPRTGIVEFGDIEEPEQLLKATYERLVEMSRPQVQFKAKVQTTGDMQLGEEVAIIRSDLDFRYKTRVFRVRRDYLNNMFTEVELGDKLTETLASRIKKIDTTINRQEQTLIQVIQTAANGKNKIFRGPVEPTEGMMVNDLWYKPIGDGEMEMYQWNGAIWELILSTLDTTKVQREVEAAIEEIEEAKRQAKLDAEKAFTDAKVHADAELERINTALSTDIDGAIELAEQAKQDAIDEAERLVAEQDTIYQEIFEGYDSAVGDLTGSIAEADNKATNALEQAGISSSLAQAAKEASERAETSASQAQTKAEEAITKANGATTKADDMLATIETFEPIVTDAQVKAEEAITKANGIPDTISDIIADKGLVSGDWVDTRIDDVTGEINYELTNVKGDIPDVIMGFEWNKVSDPTLVRTDYVEDYANLDEYNLKNAEFNLSIDGIKMNITTIEQTKLDTSVYSTFKNNEYANDVNGIRQRIAHVETNKLDDEEFRTFKEHDYEVTVDGLSGKIQVIEEEKLDSVDFNLFKSNDYQLTVDGFNMELTNISGSVPDYVLGVEWYLSDDPTLIRTNYVEEVDLTNYDNPDYVMGIEWDGISNPSLTRTDNTEDLTSKKEFEVFLGDYNFSAEGWNATNTYVTNNKTQINNLISNASGWQQTISYVDANQTKFNETISQVDSYKQTIGSNGEKITQMVMTDNAFITKVGELEGLAEDVILGVEWERVPSPVMARTGYMDDWTETQVAQISDSWVLTIKSGSDIKTQINATTDGIRLESKLTHLAGDSLIDNATIKSAHIDSLNVSKLTGTSAEFITLRSKVITADSITSEYLKVDNAFIDKLTATTAVVDRFFSKTAVIDNLSAKTLTAITANITSIRLEVLVSNVVESTHLKADTALIDKIFINDAQINRLTSKTAFINNIKAIEISASKVTTGTLNASNVSIINLNASNIVTGTLDGITVRSSFNYAYDGDILNQGVTTISNGQLTSIGTFTHAHGSTYLWLNPDGLYGENLYTDASIRSLFKLDGKGLILRTGANIATYNHNGIDFGRGFMRYYPADARIEIGSYNGAALGSFVGGNYLRRITVGGGNDGLDPFVDLWATTTMRATLNANFNQITNANHISGASSILFHNSSNRLVQLADGQLNLLSPSQLNLGWTDGSSTTNVLSVTLNQVSMFRALNLNFNQLTNANHISGADTILFNKTSNRLVQSSDGQLNILSPNQINLGWTDGSSTTNVLSVTINQVSMFRNLNMQGKAITNQSDRRLKTRISTTLVNALAIHRQLNFVDFDWIDKSTSTERQFGLIAQDSPFIGFVSEDGSWNINSSKQVMLNSLGIKELDETVTRIETFTTQHELEIKLLKDRITQLEEKVA